jgi:hypothetical protein
MKDWLKKINLNTLLIIGLVIFALLYLKQCDRTSNLGDKVKINSMNQKALLDSIRVEKGKNGTLVFEKSTLIASKKELKELNSNLYNEVKELKDNPIIIIQNTVTVIHDTIEVFTNVIKYPDGSVGLAWNYDSTFSIGNFQKLSGETRFKYFGDSLDVISTTINQNEFGISLITGLKKGDDNYEIFVKSNYPGFKITNIEGAIIDKSIITSDESSWVVGPNIGYGIALSPSGSINHGIVIGVGVTYNMNKKIKKIFRPFGL